MFNKVVISFLIYHYTNTTTTTASTTETEIIWAVWWQKLVGKLVIAELNFKTCVAENFQEIPHWKKALYRLGTEIGREEHIFKLQ